MWIKWSFFKRFLKKLLELSCFFFSFSAFFLFFFSSVTVNALFWSKFCLRKAQSLRGCILASQVAVEINTQTVKLWLVSPVSEGDNQCGRAAKFFNSSSPTHYIVHLGTLTQSICGKWKLQLELYLIWISFTLMVWWSPGRCSCCSGKLSEFERKQHDQTHKMLLKLYYNKSAGSTWQYCFIKDKIISFEKHLFSG